MTKSIAAVLYFALACVCGAVGVFVVVLALLRGAEWIVRPAQTAELPRRGFLTEKFILAPAPLTAPGEVRIAVIGDSIAAGTGIELCRMLKRRNCHSTASPNRTSAQTIRYVDVYADKILISVCTNDPSPAVCAANIATIRKNAGPSTEFYWIVPEWPRWAHDLILQVSAEFGDRAITFTPGCCTTQAKRHPASYGDVAKDAKSIMDL